MFYKGDFKPFGKRPVTHLVQEMINTNTATVLCVCVCARACVCMVALEVPTTANQLANLHQTVLLPILLLIHIAGTFSS